MTHPSSRRDSQDPPEVSFVMPVWRPRAEWLEQAVGSVLTEIGCRLELIVVDDGNVESLAQTLPLSDPRMRILRLSHGGVSRARNAGIAAAHGRYLRFVDADDVIERGSTAQLLSLTAGKTDVITYGATCFCDEHLRPMWLMTSTVQGQAALACLLGRFTVRLQSMLFPREVVGRAGPWDSSLKVSEDWEWILRSLEHAHVRGSADVATHYRRSGIGATSDIETGRLMAAAVVERWLDRNPEFRHTSVERRARAMLAAMTARVSLSHGRLLPGLAALLRSFALDPRAPTTEAKQALPAVRGVAATRSKTAVRAVLNRRPR